MTTKFMKNLDSFKSYMLSNCVSNYISSYCSWLDGHKWQWFYLQTKEPVQFIPDTNYLLYILKWILKGDFDDLSYEIYFQLIMDPEGDALSYINDEWWGILSNRYHSRIDEDICGMK